MPRLFRHVLLFAVAAIFTIGGSDKANAACVSSSDSQVIRPVFSDGSSVMYCPDGDNWSTLLSAGAGVPAGSTGQIQFNNAGAFAGDAGLFWDNTNKRLGIGTAAPAYKLHVVGGGQISSSNGSVFYTERPDSDFDFRAAAGSTKRLLSLHASSTGSTTSVFESYGHNGTNFITGLFVLNNGQVGIGTGNPTERLEIASGNVKIAPGGALKIDIFLAAVDMTVDPPSITYPQGGSGVTCSHSGWPNPILTDCTCPTGYMAISGGGYTGGQRWLRESRPIEGTSLRAWRLACSDQAGSPVNCGGGGFICTRIQAN